MSDFTIDERNKVRRGAHRAHYDRSTVYAVIDEAPLCHVGFVQDGLPYVIPTNHARVDDRIVLHGSPIGRKMQVMQQGVPLCVTFTLLDGLVLARSAFSHSVNYRSAVVFGRGHLIVESGEKLAALQAIMEHLLPGRWADVRAPNQKELDATAVISIEIESASAKMRTGPPGDSDADYALSVWAGELPIQMQFLQPIADPKLRDDIDLPDYLAGD